MTGLDRVKEFIGSAPRQTPFYIYDEKTLDRQYHLLHDNKPENLEVYYAMKGNSNLRMLQFFRDKGMGTEIASGGELFLAKHAGFAPISILYTGPAKTDEELEAAVQAKIAAIHIESVNEARRLNEICAKYHHIQHVLVRINATFEIESKVQLSGVPSPFGISEEESEDQIAQIAGFSNLKFRGVHVYNASGILQHNLLLRNVKNVFNLVRRLEDEYNIPVPVIDFGGGFGIDYSERHNNIDIQSFYIGLKEFIREFQYQNKKLIMEIARFLVAESGFYVTRIMDKKYSRGEVFLITDGGIHHFLRTKLFNENHATAVYRKNDTDEREVVQVTGALCTSMDVLARDIDLPKCEPGDYVIIQKAGCYALNAAMNHFLGHEMPAEWWMPKEGESYIIRKRGRHKDLLLNQIPR